MPDRVLAFFIQDLREGGAERTVVRLANGTVARGIATDLVVIRRSGSFFNELDENVNVVELPQTRAITSVVGLKRYFERRKPLAVVSHLTHTNIATLLANTIAKHHPRIVVVEHNQFSLSRSSKRGLVHLAYRMVPWIYPRADVIGAVSAGVRDDLSATTGISAERISTLHNPVVTETLLKLAEAPIAHPWLRGSGPPVVLAVGRFNPQKNFPLLIQAIARLRDSRPIRLIILGDGEGRAELEALVRSLNLSEDVDLPGFDPNPFCYMRAASVYVLSSDWEGLPTALIEAMACGAPIVATDCIGGPREILLDGSLGRIVPRGDANALAAAIAATLDQPGDRNARIARALTFTVESAVERYLVAAGCT